jgi:hypothetical protein
MVFPLGTIDDLPRFNETNSILQVVYYDLKIFMHIITPIVLYIY